MLPSFLSPLILNPKHEVCVAHQAIFQHKKPLGPAHCLWWPQKDASQPPDTVILFIPGNPGLVEFYIPFLSGLQERDHTSRLAILAHGHLNHIPLPNLELNVPNHSLTAQVQSAIEAFDAIQAEFGSNTKFVLIGHSVGAWIASQVLKARKDAVSNAFLLFPTISNIGNTPNGRRLSAIFKPLPRRIISSLGYAARLIPVAFLSFLFSDWPTSQLLVLQDLICSPLAIEATLSMASDEMKTIADLDLALLEDCKDKLCFYYAEKDDWVGEEKGDILTALHPHKESVSIVHDTHGTPHAFCINHGDQLAEQCSIWLRCRQSDYAPAPVIP
ncbi:hypothetical protein DFP72DRAFT_1089123 [Ephemerocybe angulata]|uniref:Lipid droplet-associated hydrolase n=1 Tax=Ephemerocybe angulata TaxID=980116 RepID=A0A8H6MHI8_9AGAR|nr:hypothetical protein DFP72DRAFT_1089123 [Tulosesus angulatus]